MGRRAGSGNRGGVVDIGLIQPGVYAKPFFSNAVKYIPRGRRRVRPQAPLSVPSRLGERKENYFGPGRDTGIKLNALYTSGPGHPPETASLPGIGGRACAAENALGRNGPGHGPLLASDEVVRACTAAWKAYEATSLGKTVFFILHHGPRL